jgi:hypothetical protein
MNEEHRRRQVEKLLVIAVVTGPFLLWFFRSGFHWGVLQWTRSIVWRTSFYTIATLSHCIASMAMLMVWRSPMNGRCVGKIALAMLFLIFGVPVAYESLAAILYPSHARWPWWLNTEGLGDDYVYGIQEVISFMVTLSCFALMRRIFGFRIVRDRHRDLPSQSPLSIAELLYWTSGGAVLFSLVPRLSELIERSGTTWPYWMIALAFAVQSPIHVMPVLVVAATPWRILIRIVVAFIGVIVLKIGQLYLTYQYAGYPIVIEYGQLLKDAFFSVSGAGLAMLWFGWHGESVVRLGGKKRETASRCASF